MSYEGKFYFTDEKILGKRFHSKHLIQGNLKFSSAVGGKNRLLKNSVLFLNVEEVNQLSDTMLKSESMPKRVTRSALNGILKDVHSWTATFIFPRQTFIQQFHENRLPVKRARKGLQQFNVKINGKLSRRLGQMSSLRSLVKRSR